MASVEKTRMRVALEQEDADPTDADAPPSPPPDALRVLVAILVQDTMRAEFDRFVGAAPYERTATRRGHRNGSYHRQLRTRIGARARHPGGWANTGRTQGQCRRQSP